jgi:hypothetical protein
VTLVLMASARSIPPDTVGHCADEQMTPETGHGRSTIVIDLTGEL